LKEQTKRYESPFGMVEVMPSSIPFGDHVGPAHISVSEPDKINAIREE
jgi:hypothetical protein